MGADVPPHEIGFAQRCVGWHGAPGTADGGRGAEDRPCGRLRANWHRRHSLTAANNTSSGVRVMARSAVILPTSLRGPWLETSLSLSVMGTCAPTHDPGEKERKGRGDRLAGHADARAFHCSSGAQQGGGGSSRTARRRSSIGAPETALWRQGNCEDGRSDTLKERNPQH